MSNNANTAQKELYKARKPGPGRPVGSIGRRTKMIRELTERALTNGDHPIEVMLENMRFYHREAHLLLEKVSKIKRPSAAAIEMLKNLCDFRNEAQKCAVDAAPYVHPRLSAVAVKTEGHMTVSAADSGMSEQQAIEDYAQAISQPLPMKLIEQIALMESSKDDKNA